MSRRRQIPRFHEPSLVPMADMLTNTVGVALFILIFTVLTAGGAVVNKRLPLARPTKAEPMHFLCSNGQIVQVDIEAIAEEYVKPLRAGFSALGAAGLADSLKRRQLDTQYFKVRGEAESIGGLFLFAQMVLERKPFQGESTAQLSLADSKYRALLSSTDASARFAEFIVFPDGLSAFRAARDIASASGFGTGWSLYGSTEALRFCLAGCSSDGATSTNQVF